MNLLIVIRKDVFKVKKVLLFQMGTVLFVVGLILINCFILGTDFTGGFFLAIGELMVTSFFFWGVDKVAKEVMEEVEKYHGV